MSQELTITLILALFALLVNIYQAHREDKIKGKIKSWLETARGIHSVAQQKSVEEISRFSNSLVADLGDELGKGKVWRSISFYVFLLAIGILIGMLI